MVFVKQDNNYINLEAVSNVNILEDKIVFNMDLSTTKKEIGLMSHYFYIDKDNVAFMDTKYFKENFVKITGQDRVFYINKTKILGIKADYKTHKIIMLFKNAVTKRSIKDFEVTDKSFLVPEFMYISQDYNVDLDKVIENFLKDCGNE